ncbi:tryptophan--tRNA ligase [Glutamicibacter sp. PS]|uniref:tryptophan--tRNA ligase n=1 Tax=Glutamicibacter sp. PS TaxID=3075634 RepID=UPI002844088F|nr:tryptophan--tRNA ligase [Glutamicibacter sp. PS]MDR4534470.1 tryptophan--tRNA ligase [Glutamicibacter sp. PS]
MQTFLSAQERSDQLSRHITQAPQEYRVLSGERPTGALHLGHYFGSIVERLRLQQAGVETFIILADYQVITDRDSMGAVRRNVHSAVLDYLAAGLDPETTTIFTHSAVPALNQLMLPFLSLISEAELHRNPTVKAERESSGRAMSGLLLTYPVHQAADILFCKANVVPVGKDNLPHVEMTRTIARRFNDRYGALFPEPDALLTAAPHVPGLDGRKMSKSYGNAIALGMSADETADLIRAVRTDSQRHVSFDPERRPGVSALLSTAALCLGREELQIAEEVGASGSGALKRLVTDAVNDFLREHRARRAEFAAQPELVSQILRRGAQRANDEAEQTLAEVRQAMGTLY